MIQRLKVS